MKVTGSNRRNNMAPATAAPGRIEKFAGKLRMSDAGVHPATPCPAGFVPGQIRGMVNPALRADRMEPRHVKAGRMAAE